VALEDMLGERLDERLQRQGEERDLGHRLERDRRLDGVRPVGPPDERSVGDDERGGCLERVELPLLEGLGDDRTRLLFVGGRDLLRAQEPRYRDGAVEVIRVRRSQARQVA
jgi:hypothetical protein